MELANHWSTEGDTAVSVRVAQPDDANAILNLLQTAPRRHLHVDWHVPGDWLGLPGFVVVDTPEQPRKLLPFSLPRHPLRACLAVAADPLPSAWVRVAALDKSCDAAELAQMLAGVLPWLIEEGAAELAWLPVERWPNRWLADLGFARVNEIETYYKQDRVLPSRPFPPDLHIRPVRSDDFDTLAQLEAAAFDPLWRHSAAALRLALPQTLSFDVAERNGRVLGFHFTTASHQGAHLVRITVHPDAQKSGVGSALMTHLLADLQQRGITTVTLNTQVDNIASQQLYRKFGFQASGQRLPVWSLPLR